MSINLTSKNSTRIQSEINQLTVVEDFIYSTCEALDFNSDNVGNVIISVTEAVNNGIIHGNSNDKNKFITISCAYESNSLYIEVSDEGEGFDFNNLPDPTAPENLEKENGRGVFLMKSLSDKIEFRNNGSKVVLTFTND